MPIYIKHIIITENKEEDMQLAFECVEGDLGKISPEEAKDETKTVFNKLCEFHGLDSKSEDWHNLPAFQFSVRLSANQTIEMKEINNPAGPYGIRESTLVAAASKLYTWNIIDWSQSEILINAIRASEPYKKRNSQQSTEIAESAATSFKSRG